jgi:hypothetical protein
MARSSVYINGKQIVVEGESAASISVINGKVIINGKVVEENATGAVELKIDGPVANITCDGNVTCGDVGGDVRANSVDARNVQGNVDAKMSVTCGNVGGNVRSGMSVACGDVRGSVDAGLSVSRR